jgi:hypothetical protein
VPVLVPSFVRRSRLISEDVFHEQVQMQFVDRRGLEPESPVEGLRLLVLGVDEQRPTADDVRGLGGAEDRIPEESSAESFPLLAAIDCETSQQNDGNGVIALTLGDAEWGIVPADGTGSESVMAGHAIPSCCHIGPRRLAPMVRSGIFAKTVIEGRASAIEDSEVVCLLKRDGVSDWRLVGH